MKLVAVLTAAVLAGSALTGCSSNYGLECDAGDYVEHDSDCGYVDSVGMWHYYDWTRPNQTTYSPNNWEPPAGVVIEQDHDDHKPKPKKSSAKPHAAPIGKASVPKSPVAKPTAKKTVAPIGKAAPTKRK